MPRRNLIKLADLILVPTIGQACRRLLSCMLTSGCAERARPIRTCCPAAIPASTRLSLDECAVAFGPDGNVWQETVCRKCSSNIGRLHRGGAAAPPMLKDFADRIRLDVIRRDGRDDIWIRLTADRLTRFFRSANRWSGFVQTKNPGSFLPGIPLERSGSDSCAEPELEYRLRQRFRRGSGSYLFRTFSYHKPGQGIFGKAFQKDTIGTLCC
jgi:hypothetical protein